MSYLKPRSLFAVEDDGLIQRLDFNDSDDEPSAFIICSPIRSNNNNINMMSDDERLDSSTDSAMSDLQPTSTAKKAPRFDVDGNMGNPSGSSPPYRKVRALRLFGSPQSPKTLLKQSELSTVEAQKKIITPYPDRNDSGIGSFPRVRRIRPPRTPKIQANINPFTQTGMFLCSKAKRPRENAIIGVSFNNTLEELVGADESNENDLKPPKRIHLRDTNILKRYETEFFEVCQIGSGQFGSVYRCINRIDGCEYALKKSRKPLKGTSDERTALNEVYAHAVLGQHTHVVRYYSAWAENDHMLIQNEYCNGGSLADAIVEKSEQGVLFSEKDVKRILLHIALGLKYIHSLNLAHMDIKPGNIFITKNPKLFPDSPRLGDSSDDGFDEDETREDEIIYKIGDLGHVTSLTNAEVDVEEGDCRYLSAEMLKDDHQHLSKADIFSLGLTIFEVCGGGPLPMNGTEWHTIRNGNLPYLSSYSKDLNKLIKQMTHPDPELRPTSTALAQNKTLVPYIHKTKEQLNKELNAEKFKNQLLSKQLEKASQSLQKSQIFESEGRLSRLIGGKMNRSSSVTNF